MTQHIPRIHFILMSKKSETKNDWKSKRAMGNIQQHRLAFRNVHTTRTQPTTQTSQGDIASSSMMFFSSSFFPFPLPNSSPPPPSSPAFNAFGLLHVLFLVLMTKLTGPFISPVGSRQQRNENRILRGWAPWTACRCR